MIKRLEGLGRESAGDVRRKGQESAEQTGIVKEELIKIQIPKLALEELVPWEEARANEKERMRACQNVRKRRTSIYRTLGQVLQDQL